MYRSKGRKYRASAALIFNFGAEAILDLIIFTLNTEKGGATFRCLAALLIIFFNLPQAAVAFPGFDQTPPNSMKSSQQQHPFKYCRIPMHTMCIQSNCIYPNTNPGNDQNALVNTS